MSATWQKVRLGEVLSPAYREEAVDPVREYRLLGVRLDGQGPFLREAVLGSQTAAHKLFRVAEGDFIYSRLFACRGAFGIVESELDGCYVSGEFPTFVPVKDKIDFRFLRYWFRLADTLDRVNQDCTGSTPLTRNRFKEQFFLSLEIPLPVLAEQRRIVARIEELSAKIAEARSLCHRAAEESEALTNSQLRAQFSSLVEATCPTPIAELITDAGYGSSEKSDTERAKGAIPVLRIPNVTSERISLNDLKFARLSDRDQERLRLYAGDILVVRTNGSLDLVGRSAVVPELQEPMAFASYMIRLRFDSSMIDSEFAQWMLRHLRVSGDLIDFARTTAGQYNVSLGRLRAAKIPVPPLLEQRCIVAYLESLQAKVDALKKLQAETAAELDAMLPSILDKAFKGNL